MTAKFVKHCVLSSGTQRALPWHHSEKNRNVKYFISSNLKPVTFIVTLCALTPRLTSYVSVYVKFCKLNLTQSAVSNWTEIWITTSNGLICNLQYTIKNVKNMAFRIFSLAYLAMCGIERDTKYILICLTLWVHLRL